MLPKIVRSIAPALFLLATGYAIAQAPANSSAVQYKTFTSVNCPINATAERQSQMTLSQIDSGTRTNSQGLHITFYDNPKAIESVEITVHALPRNPRVTPAATNSSNITKTFQFHRQPGTEDLTTLSLWLDNAGLPRWADITTINYSDGTQWHATPTAACRITPSLFVLVARQ